MIYLIYSDVHSNLEALQAFSYITDSIVHDKKVCLGDLVGYGADPNPCVNFIRENTDLILGGNHDYAVVEKTDTSYFNPYAYQACLWTKQALSKKNLKFLKSLPAIIEEDEICWAHSSPYEPEQWHYILSLADGQENFDHFESPVCFVGHSHVPLILERDPQGQIEMYRKPFYEFQPDHKYIVNVGSLGQPRDGNPDPGFVIYDSESKTVAFRRFTYDLESAQKKILDAELPPYLAERLSDGR